MADGRHIENRFWLYLGAILAHQHEISNGDEGSQCQYRSRVQNCNFRKFKMADGRHFEITLSPYLSREWSDFEQIWWADVHFNSHDGHLTKKSKLNFANSRWRTDAILKIVFWPYLGAMLRNNIDSICTKASTWIHYLKVLKRSSLFRDDLLYFYSSVIRPVLEYAFHEWHTSLTQQQTRSNAFRNER